jgi:O-antigen/teichoic acid export membrane protein
LKKLMLGAQCDSIRRKTSVSALWQAAGALYIYAARLVSLVVLARLLSAHDFGLLASASIFMGLASILIQAIALALIRCTTLEEPHITSAFWLSITAGVLNAFLLIALAPFLASLLRSGTVAMVIQVMAPSLIVVGISNVSLALLQRQMQFRTIALVQAISYTTGYLCVGIIMAKQGLSYWALVGAHYVEVTVNSTLTIFVARFRIRAAIDWRSTREILQYALFQTLNNIASYVGSQIDKFLVAKWLGVSSLGFYTRASFVANIPTTLLESILSKVVFAAAAQLQGNPSALRRGTLQGITISLLVLVPFALFCSTISSEIISALLGERWLPSAPIFAILIMGTPLDTLSRFLSSVLLATGNPARVLRISFKYLVTTAVCTAIGLNFGVTGVALGVLMSFCFVTLGYLTAISHRLGQLCSELKEVSKRSIMTSVGTLVPTEVCLVMTEYYGMLPITQVILCATVSVTTVLLLWRWLPNQFLGRLGKDSIYSFTNYVVAAIRRENMSYNTTNKEDARRND